VSPSGVTAAPSPRAPSNAEPAAPRRPGDAALRDACDAFGQVLKGKQQAPRRDAEPQDAAGDAALAAFGALSLRFTKAESEPAASTPSPSVASTSGPGFSRAPDEAPPSAAGAPDVPQEGPRASLQAALNAGVPVAPLFGSDPAAVWEASLGGPHHGSVTVRAERLVNAGSPPVWALDIGVRGVDAELMLRHAPRLNERLRKHGVQLDHVRIESPEDDADR
jgi:hypothetical protein